MEATAMYDFKARESDELSFVKGQKLKIVSMEENATWYTAEAMQRGLVPSNYIKMEDNGTATGLYYCRATKSDELSFVKEQKLTIVSMEENSNWYTAEAMQRGFVPRNHIKMKDNRTFSPGRKRVDIGSIPEDVTSGSSPPFNFSWVDPGRICASAWPEFLDNISFLKSEGVGHIVTLSQEMQPPAGTTEMGLQCHLIDVPEFTAPTMAQIKYFIGICDLSHSIGEAVCVHCRMGVGRTGTMLACYLVKYYNKAPQEAISQVRQLRPYSIETEEQEDAVEDYYEHIRTCVGSSSSPPHNFSWIDPGRICASAWPKFLSNVAFLKSKGVGHIVTLSRERQPPAGTTEMGLQCHLIDVQEFTAPTIAQINKFIGICDLSRSTGVPICVHCRQGMGRTGTMLACYLLKYYNKSPHEAISQVRQLRPYSIETQEQEDAVEVYYKYICQVPQTYKDGASN